MQLRARAAFLRRFVQATGLKLSDYQRRLRVMRAREMLEFNRSPVDAIAVAVGYSEVRNFRRVFSNIVGLTPPDYRRRFYRLPRSAGCTQSRPANQQRVR
jgi:transcriptional regulator GlxA family with amidase domain